MDQARAFGRTLKAGARVRGWVGAVDREAGDVLAARPGVDLAGAQRALGRAAATLARVDRARALEEAQIAVRAADSATGDAALIAGLVGQALDRALAGGDDAVALRAPGRAMLRAVA